MSRLLAGLLTMMLMGLMLWSGLHRSKTSSHLEADSEPESARGDSRQNASTFPDQTDLERATGVIESLLASARDGDVASYLGAFGGSVHPRLQREADERGSSAFAAALRRAGLARRSHSVFAPELEAGSSAAVRIVVESIFADRVERQSFRLEHTSGRWLVTGIETAREHVPEPALGSLATYREPEGNPVATGAIDSVSDTPE
jgi:hypothetical protein